MTFSIFLLTNIIVIQGLPYVLALLAATMLFKARRIKAFITKNGNVEVPIDPDSHQRRKDINAVHKVVKEINEVYNQKATFNDGVKYVAPNKAEKKRRAANRRNNGKK